jgi:hypothetical protein
MLTPPTTTWPNDSQLTPHPHCLCSSSPTHPVAGAVDDGACEAGSPFGHRGVAGVGGLSLRADEEELVEEGLDFGKGDVARLVDHRWPVEGILIDTRIFKDLHG